MWNPNFHAINIPSWCRWFTRLDSDILSVLVILRGITLIILNECLGLIAINFNWSIRLWSVIQQEISSTKLHQSLLTHPSSHTFSIHCTNFLFFFNFSCVFTFLELIKYNMLKMLLFSSFFKY